MIPFNGISYSVTCDSCGKKAGFGKSCFEPSLCGVPDGWTTFASRAGYHFFTCTAKCEAGVRAELKRQGK
jgi:hypothetical protein